MKSQTQKKPPCSSTFKTWLYCDFTVQTTSPASEKTHNWYAIIGPTRRILGWYSCLSTILSLNQMYVIKLYWKRRLCFNNVILSGMPDPKSNIPKHVRKGSTSQISRSRRTKYSHFTFYLAHDTTEKHETFLRRTQATAAAFFKSRQKFPIMLTCDLELKK